MTDFLKTNEGEGNPRAASMRIEGDSRTGHASQRNHDLRKGPKLTNVKYELTHLNDTLIEPPMPGAMFKLASERRSLKEMKRAMKKTACVSFAGIISFGSEAAVMFESLPKIEQNRAFKLLAYLAARQLKTSLHGLVVHRDESTVHAHFTLCGYTRDGVALSKATRPSDMAELQDLTARVLQRFCPGVERGFKYGDRLAAGASYVDVVHKSVRQLHRELPADIAKLKDRRERVTDLLNAAETRLADATARHVEMEGRVEKLKAKAELNAAEAKRLKTYESRLAARSSELDEARSEVERLREEARSKVQAVSAGVEALAVELQRGTLHLSDDRKRILVSNPGPLEALPELKPGIKAIAEVVSAIKLDRVEVRELRRSLEAAERQLINERLDFEGERSAFHDWSRRQANKLKDAMRLVATFFRRGDLTDEAREEAKSLGNVVKGVLSAVEASPIETRPSEAERPGL